MGNVIMKARQIQHGATNVEEALNLLSPEELIEMSKRMDAIEAWKNRVRDSVNTGSNSYIINNALKVPVKALSLNMLPIQSGSGDPSPENVRPISGRTEVNLGRTGKNLLPMTVAGIKAANTSGTWNGNNYTISGVTFAVQTDSDGNVTGVKTTGTASATCRLNLITNFSAVDFSGMIINGCNANGSDSKYFITVQQANSPWATYATDYGSGATIASITGAIQIFIGIVSGQNTNGLAFYPMIRDAAESDPTFAPYKGSVTLTIALGTTVYGGSLDVKTGVLTVTNVLQTFDGSDDESWGTLSGDNFYQFTMTISDAKDMLNFITNEFQRMDIYYRGQQTGAIYYNDKILRIALLPDMNITTVAEWRAWLAQNPLQICYELATPTTVQLTGAELEMLKGYNYISTDADSMDVTALVLGGEA